MDPQTEHNPNRIPYRGFFGKPVGSMAWSLASNESIYSLHTGNVSLSREYGFVGLAAALKLDETQKSNELVNKITETNPVLSLSLSPVKESLNTVQSDYENDDENKGEDMIKPTNEEDEISDVSGEVENDVKEIKQEDSSELVYEITETNLTPPLPPVEKSENCKKPKSESDDNKDEEIIKFHSEEHEISGLTEKQEEREEVEDDDDLGKEIKPNESNEPVNQITETDLVPLKESRDTEKSDSESDDEDEMKEEVEDDLKEIIADDSSICCRSDTSNNSISSFSFPMYNSALFLRDCLHRKKTLALILFL